MQVDNRFIDDLARVAAGAVGALSGVRQEVEARLKERFQRLFANLDLVRREELDAAHATAAKARAEQKATAARLAALEARLAALETKPTAKKRKAPDKARTTPKPAAKARAKRKRPAKRRS